MRSISNRNADLASCIKTGVSAGTKSLRCACPGIIQAWNAVSQTVTVQLAIKEILKIDGVETETEIPLLVDVPIVVPRAGGYSLLLVPKAGDECLVIFSDMCIDSWWQSGGVQSQAERRRHDLSDGFAVLGCWSQPNKPENYPDEGISLQNADGSVAIRIDSKGAHFIGIDVGKQVKDLVTQDNGVAVGSETESPSAENKIFQVAADHKTLVYGSAKFKSGLSVTGNVTATGTIQGNLHDENGCYSGGTYSTIPVRVGTWIDGNFIYRIVCDIGTTIAGTATYTYDLPVSIGTLINLYGAAYNSSTGWHPFNSYYSSGYHLYARLSSSQQLTIHAGAKMTAGYVVLEYIV